MCNCGFFCLPLGIIKILVVFDRFLVHAFSVILFFKLFKYRMHYNIHPAAANFARPALSLECRAFFFVNFNRLLWLKTATEQSECRGNLQYWVVCPFITSCLI